MSTCHTLPAPRFPASGVLGPGLLWGAVWHIRRLGCRVLYTTTSSNTRNAPCPARHSSGVKLRVPHAASMAIAARLRAAAALLLAVLAGSAAEVDYTDMQKWAGLLAQSFLTHSDDVGHAHSQLAQFKALMHSKVRRRTASARQEVAWLSGRLVHCKQGACPAAQTLYGAGCAHLGAGASCGAAWR